MSRKRLESPRSLLSQLNVADRLDEFAASLPQAIAVAEPTRRVETGCRVYRTITFRQLADDVSEIARGLISLGIKPGVRLALLVPPSIDFIALVFALLKSGAVQILIDPGMGRRNLLACLAETQPEGFVALPAVHAVRQLLSRRFPRAKLNVTVGRRLWWGGLTIDDVRKIGNSIRADDRDECCAARSSPVHTTADDPAAIIFTTGSTGPPKGVLYRHGNFDRQVTELCNTYQIKPGEIDLPCFSLFGLFNAAMGVTTVLPRMNFARPAKVDPRNIVEAVEQWQVTQSFASPAVWNRVGTDCRKRGIRLKSLRRIISAGAPVPARVLSSMKEVIHPMGDVHVAYGATEALPVATIPAADVLAKTWRCTEQGGGICVGGRFPGIEWRVIRIVDGPIGSIKDSQAMPRGEIGELIVRGPVVTTEYVTRPEANELAKIVDESHEFGFWHRMGDAGYLDDQDRFWFCGRIAHRVITETGTSFTIPIEARFNVLRGVACCALVGVGPRGHQQPAIVAELVSPPRSRRASHFETDHFRTEIENVMRETGVRHLLVNPRKLPVDIRHNAKILREQLAVWAEKQLRRRRSPKCVWLRDVT